MTRTAIAAVFRAALLVSSFIVAPSMTMTAVAQDKEKAPPPPSIDAATGKILSEAIEFLNTEKYNEAQAKISTLKLEELSPFERSKVEQILISIAIAKEDYAGARKHIEAAIAAGGLNEQEVSQIRYQRAQLFIQEQNWKEGAAAIEDWMKTAVNPNSAAYYLLAVAYYQLENIDKALPNAKKAVDLMDKPQESWVSLLAALYLQKNQFKEAVPYLERLIAFVPNRKNYWLQLSGVYQQLEEFPKALALTQIAYDAGLLTDDADIRRLSELQLFNGAPYRCGLLLESEIEKKRVKVDESLYEKVSNCWIAAAEYEKAVPPLTKAGDMAATGDHYARVGEVHIHREDWPAAEASLKRAIDKGKLKDLPNAQMLLAIALYNQEKLSEAERMFSALPKNEKFSKMSRGYLQMIEEKRKQAKS